MIEAYWFLFGNLSENGLKLEIFGKLFCQASFLILIKVSEKIDKGGRRDRFSIIASILESVTDGVLKQK
ncbi:MAG: hypothetical protein QME50_05920 [Candidatus Bathyarchaeota archaeon]|nr:hypothetical protein [Candidatus Bathyarchaeota archaeon]